MVVFVDGVSETAGWNRENAEYPHYAGANGGQDGVNMPNPLASVPLTSRTALLNRLVATEILPRLALARRASAEAITAAQPRVTTYDDTGAFVCLLLAPEEAGGFAFVEALLLRGASAESLYTGILPDAARWLGLMWEEDRCDFTQVTIALGRLQKTARMLSPRFQAASVTLAKTYSLLLLPTPGDQHTFGLLILAEFFQRAGWHVEGGPKSAGMDAPALARETWFDVAGFSIGSERLLESLAATIRLVRRASRNRSLRVMVGGPLFQQRPELAALAGADVTALDANGAVRLASDLLALDAAAR